MRTKLAHTWKTGFIFFFYQLSRNPVSDLGAAENFIMGPVEAEQNHRRSLRNTRECARRQENGEQARRPTRNASLRSRRLQESTEQLEQQRQARNANLRLRRQQESAKQMGQLRQARNDSLRSRRQQESAKQLEQLRQARRESDRQRRQRQRLAQTDSHRQPLLIEFKSDLLTLLDHCTICSHAAFIGKTKKVSTSTLLETCPEFQPEHPTHSVLCSKCKTQTSKKVWPSWATSSCLCPDDIPVELVSLSSELFVCRGIGFI